MKSPEATKVNQQNDTMLGQKGHQRSGTGFAETRLQLFLMNFVEKDFLP